MQRQTGVRSSRCQTGDIIQRVQQFIAHFIGLKRWQRLGEQLSRSAELLLVQAGLGKCCPGVGFTAPVGGIVADLA